MEPVRYLACSSHFHGYLRWKHIPVVEADADAVTELHMVAVLALAWVRPSAVFL